MKILALILLNAVLLSCSSDDSALNAQNLELPVVQNIRSSVHFDDLYMHLQAHVGQYLDDPFGSLWYLNRRTRSNFKYSLKFYVSEIFAIPEMSDIKNDEPEFLNLLSLTWSRGNRFVFFCALIEEIINKKQGYKKLLRPLLWYLHKTFKTLDAPEQNEYREFLSKKYQIDSFEEYFAQLCLSNNQYDLVKELITDPSQIEIYFSFVENKKALLEFFSSMPHFVSQYLNSFKNQNCNYSSSNAIEWIVTCIVFEAPEEFYSDLLSIDPELFNEMVRELFFSLEIPESKYPRIHSQIKYLLSKYLQTDNGEFLNLLNDVRYGELQDLNEMNFSQEDLNNIAIASVAANKSHVFLTIYDHSGNTDEKMTLLDRVMSNYYRNAFRAPENFKFIIDLVAVNPKILEIPEHFQFIMNFYAIRRLIYFNVSTAIIEFVVLENTAASSLGFLDTIRTSIDGSASYFNFIFELAFSSMKVFNEESLMSFLSDYGNFPKEEFYEVQPAVKVLEMIANSSNLVDKIIETNSKFTILTFLADFATSKYLDLLDFDGAEEIIKFSSFDSRTLTTLRSKKHFEIIEKITKRRVADYFADIATFYPPINEFDYYEWRFSFDYLIKSDQRHRIREIRSPGIVRLLRLEFPNEMNEILED